MAGRYIYSAEVVAIVDAVAATARTPTTWVHKREQERHQYKVGAAFPEINRTDTRVEAEYKPRAAAIYKNNGPEVQNTKFLFFRLFEFLGTQASVNLRDGLARPSISTTNRRCSSRSSVTLSSGCDPVFWTLPQQGQAVF